MAKYDGQKLAKLRLAAGWSQTKLSKKAGLSVATISYMECGKRNNPTTWARVAKTLGHSLAKLVADNG